MTETLTPTMTDLPTVIIETVAKYCYVEMTDLKAPNKGKREVCDCRHICVSLLKKYTDMTYDSIGSNFANRDHSTVIHSLRVSDGLLESDKVFRAKYELCDEQIKKYISYES